jgi:hypothetical protein
MGHCDQTMTQTHELLTLVCCYLVDVHHCGDLTIKTDDLEPYRSMAMTSYLDEGLLTLKLRTPEGAQREIARLKLLKGVDT